MLKRVEGWFRRRGQGDATPAAAAGDTAAGLGLRPVPVEMLDAFLETVRLADYQGCSPWVLREEQQLATFRRALEHLVQSGVWLQVADEGVEHWDGRLMSLCPRPTEPLGFVLACRPQPEAAWQLRFFGVPEQWRGRGHGRRLLQQTREAFRGEPCVARLPVVCEAAARCLEGAGFERQGTDAKDVMHYEAPAYWGP
ncbi:GNAT family N-acetyltransferase [Thioalkalivibrio sp. ALR17-21]|uniref:GNAT family N-acetyltransferase n=1 Tax=Thioalkalivibrio sp. ALR17-21 TaxID=1269813 RepID=UPI000462E6F5|nr:GNAT family N-acetyltransferase [Thioalkalivibrio sp. ALR17-21]